MSLEPSRKSASADLEGSTVHGLFTLRLRVVWLENQLPRYKFRPPQAASLRRVGAPRPERDPKGGNAAPQLSALEKYALIRETGECCYWCARSIGQPYPVRGETVALRLHWDHVIPSSAGGLTDITNVVPSCHVCNQWKSDRVFATEAEVRAYLEQRWNEPIHQPDVSGAEEPSVVADIAADVPSDTAPDVAPNSPGETPSDAHTTGPEEAVPFLRAFRAKRPVRHQYKDARVAICKCGTPFRPETRPTFQSHACFGSGCSAAYPPRNWMVA